jgi:hypothetical protein
VAVAVVVPPVPPFIMATVMLAPVFVGMVMDAFVVAVAVGIVGVEATRMLMCGHGVCLQWWAADGPGKETGTGQAESASALETNRRITAGSSRYS